MATRDAPRTWIDACASFAEAHAVPAWVLEDLHAFSTPFPRGGPPARPEAAWQGTFEALEAGLEPALDVEAVAGLLAPEAEGAQPRMFARRVSAVDRILEGQGGPAARVLRVGLRMRLDGIASHPRPRLRRVRALADFYYSLAARLRHPEWAERSEGLGALLDAAVFRHVAAGIEHAILDGLALGMPVHVNVLRVDPGCVRMRVEDLRAPHCEEALLPDVLGDDVLAAVSGGFFLYSEDDIEAPSRRHDPVGLLLRDGGIVAPPVFSRAALLVDAAGRPEIRVVRLAELDVAIAGRPVRFERIVNRAASARGPDAPSVSVVGSVVQATGRSLPVPLNGFVAVVDAQIAADVTAGDAVRYGRPSTQGGSAVTGIAGGPMIVRDGVPVLDMRGEDFWGTAPPITFSQDETGDRNLLARMALGLDAEGRLVAAAVDGRNVERALGMTLGDTARLMIRLGCVTAMNLDGGSSKRMCVQGRIVDLPNTEIVAGEADVVRVRPVHSAIVFSAR